MVFRCGILDGWRYPPDMLDVLHNYEGSVLLMDEAHASGAIGATGRGIYEHFGICQRAIERGVVPVIMTTFSCCSAGAAISSHVAELKPLLNVSPTSLNNFFASTNHCCCLESIRQVRKFQKSRNASGKYSVLAIAWLSMIFSHLRKPMLYR